MPKLSYEYLEITGGGEVILQLFRLLLRCSVLPGIE